MSISHFSKWRHGIDWTSRALEDTYRSPPSSADFLFPTSGALTPGLSTKVRQEYVPLL
jgi:hypothetical protein